MRTIDPAILLPYIPGMNTNEPAEIERLQQRIAELEKRLDTLQEVVTNGFKALITFHKSEIEV